MIDTSAWVEFLRDTGSAACTRVEALLGAEIAVCDPIRMEVLAGARDEAHLGRLRRLLATARAVPTGPAHYDGGAALYRLCRLQGETPRRMLDCLIAAVAVDAGIPVLHADGDFDVLARHTALKVA
ncbi:MAG: PIN domain nuclease [Actinobacteria bacterium]|jgi:predicted nucleic acid-binding protein|nr:PIN domain nuclease [Actinomycetota bacterium]